MILYNCKLIRRIIGGEWYKVTFQEVNNDFIFESRTLWTRNYHNYKNKSCFELLKTELWLQRSY
jgi:hypothetical protein